MNGHTPDVISWTRIGDDEDIAELFAAQRTLIRAHTQGLTMSNVNDLMPSKYLKGSDVTPPKIVTIAGLKQENLAREDQPKKLRWTMLFEEVEKPLVLNKTNLKRCAKALGSEETDDWIGKKIKLYFDEEVEFGGEQVGGIRVTSAAKRRSEAEDIDELNEQPPF